MIALIIIIGIIILFYFAFRKKTIDNSVQSTNNKQTNTIQQKNNYLTIFEKNKGYASLMGIRYYMKGNNLEFSLNEQVYLIPEPENVYDKNAIKVITNKGVKIGYISKFNNKEILELMQEGYQFMVKISTINLDEPDYPYVSLEIIKTKEQNVNSLTNEEISELDKQSVKEEKKYKQDSKVSYELTKKGLELERNKEIIEAIKYFEEAIKLPQTPPIAFNRLAIYYRKSKDYSNEIRVLNRNIESIKNSKAFDNIKRDEIRKVKERIRKAKKLSEKDKT